jgi:hypothetical protein
VRLGVTTATSKEIAMNALHQHLAHQEIDRRLRDADHYRRLRWGRPEHRRERRQPTWQGCTEQR